MTDAGKYVTEDIMNSLINNLANTIAFFDVDQNSRLLKNWDRKAIGA